MTLTDIATNILSVLTVVGQFWLLLIILASLTRKKSISSKFLSFISNHAIMFSFIVALIAVSGSLFYSEIAGYEPCKLCWIQRIFMYPQVLILGVALWKKDKKVFNYIIPLCLLGIIFASYHYYLQLGGTPLTSCDAGATCARRYTFHFGYVTIPMMALTAFVLNIIFAMNLKYKIGVK